MLPELIVPETVCEKALPNWFEKSCVKMMFVFLGGTACPIIGEISLICLRNSRNCAMVCELVCEIVCEIVCEFVELFLRTGLRNGLRNGLRIGLRNGRRIGLRIWLAKSFPPQNNPKHLYFPNKKFANQFRKLPQKIRWAISQSNSKTISGTHRPRKVARHSALVADPVSVTGTKTLI